MTHDDLVKRAETWLRNTKRCRVVAKEFVAGPAEEIPDVIGWMGRGSSYLVECKISLSDFQHDKRKVSRVACPDMAIGRHRIYFVTPEVAEKIKTEEILEGWGLVVAYKNQVRYKKHEVPFDLTPEGHRREKVMLTSMAWRALEAVSLVKPFAIGDPQVAGKGWSLAQAETYTKPFVSEEEEPGQPISREEAISKSQEILEKAEEARVPYHISPIEVIAQVSINKLSDKGRTTAPREVVEKALLQMYPRATPEDVEVAIERALKIYDIISEDENLVIIPIEP